MFENSSQVHSNSESSRRDVVKHADDSWQCRWWLLMAVAGKPAAWMCNWGHVLDMEGYHFMVHTNDNLPPTTVYTYIIIAVMAETLRYFSALSSLLLYLIAMGTSKFCTNPLKIISLKSCALKNCVFIMQKNIQSMHTFSSGVFGMTIPVCRPLRLHMTRTDTCQYSYPCHPWLYRFPSALHFWQPPLPFGESSSHRWALEWHNPIFNREATQPSPSHHQQWQGCSPLQAFLQIFWCLPVNAVMYQKVGKCSQFLTMFVTSSFKLNDG